MTQVTYNTTRWQWMTWIGVNGSIFSERLIDSANPADTRNLAEALDTAPGRVHVRPASVAEVTGYGHADIARVDAVAANGEMLNKHSGLHKGEAVVEIKPEPTDEEIAAALA